MTRYSRTRSARLVGGLRGRQCCARFLFYSQKNRTGTQASAISRLPAHRVVLRLVRSRTAVVAYPWCFWLIVCGHTSYTRTHVRMPVGTLDCGWAGSPRRQCSRCWIRSSQRVKRCAMWASFFPILDVGSVCVAGKSRIIPHESPAPAGAVPICTSAVLYAQAGHHGTEYTRRSADCSEGGNE